MSRGSFHILVAFAALVAPGLAPAAAAPQSPEIRLREAEERLAAALVSKDATAFEQLLAPEFVLRGAPDVPRALWIANAQKLCWGDRAGISDFRVLRWGDRRAVVALVLTTGRDPATCERATVRSLITDIWERRGGAWQLVLRHSGPAGGIEAQFLKTAAPPPRWEGSAELSLVDTGGNADTQTLGTAATLTWRPGQWTTEARTSFVRSEAGEVETARSFAAAVRQARTISPRLDAFARGEYLVNEFAGIDDRISVDTGLGFRVLTGPAHRLRTDAGLGYSHEDRLGGEDLSFALATAGAQYEWTVNRLVTLADTSLLTTSLQDGEDWRFRNALAITATLTRRVSIKVAHELNFAHAPAPGFGSTDTMLSAALVVGF